MKKAFTLIELVVVIALVAILSVNLGSKVIAQINKSKVSRVLDTLSNLQTELRILQVEEGKDIDSIEELFFLLDEEYSTLSSGTIEESSEIYPTRTNQGGWIYDTTTSILEANLPNGAYTGNILKEIWGEITGITVDYNSYRDNNTPIKTGNGDDFINIGRLLKSAVVFSGDGNDVINIGQTRSNSTVDTGNGDDVINIDQTRSDSVINSGNGNDSIAIDQARGSSIFNAGEGNDSININTLKNNSTVNAEGGNDKVAINNVSSNFDNGSVNLGGGNDTLTIIDNSSSTNLRKIKGLFDGGEGNDTLNLSNITVDQWNTRISSNFKNFTTVNLADGVIRNF